jgi:hypothetical protein
MSVMNDVRSIINPLPLKYTNDFIKNVDNILENLIIHNNMTYNSFIFNHIIYNNNNSNLKETIIDILKKHILNNVKNNRINFRNLNKKNMLNIVNFNNYFDSFYKLLIKLNSMFLHMIPLNNDNSKKWGDSIIINYGIDCIARIICEDVIIKSALIKNLKDSNGKKSTDIYKLNIFIKNMSTYLPNIYSNFLKQLEESFIELIPIINMPIDNINHVYNFNSLYKYYMNIYYNYHYITGEHNFTELITILCKKLEYIISNNDMVFVKNFIITYKIEIHNLTKFIDMKIILLSCKPTDINTFITYYLTLYEISNNNGSFNNLINYCIKEDVNKYINTPDTIEILADTINTMIINKENNRLPYMLGYYINNKDEFITSISQKLMERIIYTDINSIIEESHSNLLKLVFQDESKLLYKYNKILEDYVISNRYKTIDTNIPDYVNVIITSYDIWKINYKMGYSDNIIEINLFTKILNDINTQYYTYFPSRKLIQYLHIGYVNINIGDSNLIVLPAHMCVLELFTNNSISYDMVFNIAKTNLTHYSDDFIKKLIESLIIGNVITKENNMLKLRTDMISYINMIDIFHNMHNTSIIIKKLMYEELCSDRIDIICANINHFVKKSNDYDIESLYIIISKNINTFEMNKELYQQAIDKMIKNDYIKFITNNKIEKILYSV